MRINKSFRDEKLPFKYVVNVTTEGIFSTYLPADVVEKLESCGIFVPRGRGGKKGHFESDSLVSLREKIKAVVEKFSERKLVSSKIILSYAIITACSYMKTKAGETVPNGYWTRRIDKTEDYKWFSGTQKTDACNRTPYGFRVYVQPYKLNTYVFPDKTEHKEYTKLTEDDFEEGSTLDWLNSLCSIGDDGEKTQDVEYTEEIGLFFKNAIISICLFDEKLKKVFGERLEISAMKVKLLPKPMEGK